MYLTINDFIGEKGIDLSCPIHSNKKIAVVSMHSVLVTGAYRSDAQNGLENCAE